MHALRRAAEVGFAGAIRCGRCEWGSAGAEQEATGRGVAVAAGRGYVSASVMRCCLEVFGHGFVALGVRSGLARFWLNPTATAMRCSEDTSVFHQACITTKKQRRHCAPPDAPRCSRPSTSTLPTRTPGPCTGARWHFPRFPVFPAILEAYVRISMASTISPASCSVASAPRLASRLAPRRDVLRPNPPSQPPP